MTERLSKFGYVVSRVFSTWISCYNSAFNFLFYLPCGGETSFRRRCFKFASLAAGDSILDVCCGAGELTSVIARQGLTGQVFGVDISESALDLARRKTPRIPATFLRASADCLPFDSSRFDKCFVSFGLHHMGGKQRRRTLIEIHRILAPKGTLYVIDYNLPESGLRRLTAVAFTKLDESKEAYQMLQSRSLTNEIRKARFQIERRDLACQGIIQLLEMVKM
ncbi:MAG TPA: class I SAM-dependent methyltransferase [Dehalococcoidia bacterium]|nr:class I SAM-dependent methyltransferase [Dehalococcoidia bacterium]